MLRLFVGGWWEEPRRFSPGLCCRCGKEPGTVMHHIWRCSETMNDQHETVTSSNHLALQATEAWPAYWQRFLPIARAFPDLPPVLDFSFQWGSIPQHMCHLHALCTDGSGGSRGSHPETRRVGWGMAIIPPGAREPVFFAGGSVLGGQTVPRAELTATIRTGQLVGSGKVPPTGLEAGRPTTPWCSTEQVAITYSSSSSRCASRSRLHPIGLDT